MASNWFEFKASAESPESDLYLYGEVGGWGASATEFIDALSTRKDQRINLHIHSPGGSVFEGHAIYNALRNHPGGVTTMVDGIAASMASVIAMAGNPVKIASNGFLMIHNPWSQAAGGSEEMRKQADVLDKLKDSLVKIYADKSGMPEDEIAAAMDDETWLNAEEAVAFGLADEIFSGMQAAAKIDLSSISAKAPSGVLEFANKFSVSVQDEKTQENKMDTETTPEEGVVLADESTTIEEPVAAIDFQAALTKTAQELTEAHSRISSLSEELNAAQARLSAYVAECEVLNVKLETERAKNSEVSEQVNAKAAALVAQAGHAPVAIAAQSDDKIQPVKGSNILERFAELRKSGTSSVWMAFLKEHRNELLAAAKTTK